jgi:hypothetical protein
LRVGKLDLDVLLFNAGKLAVKFIGFREFLDIEAGLEGPHVAAATVVLVTITAGVTRVGVEVIEETEERGEGGGVGVDEGSWEERHLACCDLWREKSSLGCSDW